MSESMPPARPDPAVPPAPASPGYSSAPPGALPPYNTMAILGFVLVWFTVILGIIFGHIALSQIKRTGERGHGLALAAVIIGWIELALGIIITVIVLVSLGFFALSTGGGSDGQLGY